jgi:Tfp pilus assembly protein PilX
MGKSKGNSRGFTLIAALLLTILLSGLAIGLLYMVGNEVRMGGNDLEGNMAFYGAEAGIETLTANLSQLYQTTQTPVAADVNALTNPANFPTAIVGSNIANTNYTETITWPLSNAAGDPRGTWDVIGSGQDQGLIATIIPYNLQVTATRVAGSGQVAANSVQAASGAAVNMTRTVEVAQIPAFEFGVFCDGDCDYFAGPNFNFGGRVHTNGNLFLASGSKLTFTDKIAAVGQVILDQLENGHATAAGYTGTVYAPNASNGCPPAPGQGPQANCLALTQGSWTGGFPTATGSANSGWTAISKGTFNGFIVNGLTGATKLQLPFVQAGVGPIEITRKPQPTDSLLMSNSRLYKRAEIRVLLADTQFDLHPERGMIGDGQDIQFGVSPVNGASTQPVLLSSTGTYMYYANADTTKDPNWVRPTSYTPTTWNLLGEVTSGFNATTLPTAWIRVEYLNTAGTGWVGVTKEWLAYGFGRDTVPPTAPSGSAGANPIPAILILQESKTFNAVKTDITAAGTVSKYNWYPINFYDSREGEPRDAGARGGNTCSPIGLMNAVELDVGNLNLWLKRQGPYAGSSGNNVNSTKDNGYILYFADHRGMIPDPDPNYAGRMSGSSLLEDVINTGSQPGVPDGVLEAPTIYVPPISNPALSPEDVDKSGTLNQQGAQNLGRGFGVPLANITEPYYIPGVTAGISCPTAAANMVTGPRHVLRLVDGGMNAAATSYLPTPGFTVASEEPVYVYGDYNTSTADPFWASNGTNNTTPHSAAAIIADAVTLLSPNWADSSSLNSPGDVNGRPSSNSYYRVAIAAGKSIPFPQPAWGGQDFGTDGGMHNFLRYLENRGGTTVNYTGSLISMYYSQYATGTFKCCNVVYNAPTRNYFFDRLFLNPANLPPGTPMFQDVVSLSYHQNFTPQ